VKGFKALAEARTKIGAVFKQLERRPDVISGRD
jgi:hypothetical protein